MRSESNNIFADFSHQGSPGDRSNVGAVVDLALSNSSGYSEFFGRNHNA